MSRKYTQNKNNMDIIKEILNALNVRHSTLLINMKFIIFSL